MKRPLFEERPIQAAGNHLSPFTSHYSRFKKAFSLVEVTVAVGIAGFALLAIFGLLPAGLNSNQASINQTTAANLAGALVADLRSTGKTSPPSKQTSPVYKIELPDRDIVTHTVFLRENGSPAGDLAADAVDKVANPAKDPRFRAAITFFAPANPVSKTATTARILITWPALADKNPSTGTTNPPTNPATQFSGSYEVVTTLDRNTNP